jgi:YVTN family beta-propeller protein
LIDRMRRVRTFSIGLVAVLTAAARAAAGPADDLTGMPPLLDRQDVYAGARAGRFSPNVSGFPDRIYVPNSVRNTVQVIDPHTFKVIDQFAVGRQPQHVVPSYDLKTLWVVSDLGDNLTRIDPSTGHANGRVKVKDPYNMYFTPDGKNAIVVAERVRRLDFRDAHTMALVESVQVPCRGVNHMDFSANGRYFLASPGPG